jgi:hypothetical protein
MALRENPLRTGGLSRAKHTHIFKRDRNDRYVEPRWCSARLFALEHFDGAVHDPAAGTGQILTAATAAGLDATGADIAPLKNPALPAIDFFTDTTRRNNIITNPPYGCMREFAEHALTLAERKAALLVPLARLNAARWLEATPLRRVLLLTPRPSIPPLSYIRGGGKPQGGRVDFCWLVWERGYRGRPQLRWLARGGECER